MKMLRLCSMLAGASLVPMASGVEVTGDMLTQLARGQACSVIPSKIERLACFDAAFETPIHEDNTQIENQVRPEEWVRANGSEAKRTETDTGFLLNYAMPNQPKSGIWLTATALPDREQQTEDMPILMFSCIDNISRVELILRDVASEGVAQVYASSAYSVTQRWMSDDSGYVFRAGRGLPAIEVMKAIMSGNRAVLRADIPSIRNLTFDTAELKQAIKPLRQTCRW